MRQRSLTSILKVTVGSELCFFTWNLFRFFPNTSGHLGHDYGAFIPWMVSGLFWRVTNGLSSIPEFVPAFCAGVPLVFNPQSVYFSLPSLLLTFLPPVPSVAVSWITFGLIGGLSVYGLLRRVFQVSPEAAAVGGALFLLNGFFFFRMVIGHITFHPFMLVPAMFWSIARPLQENAIDRELVMSITGRAVMFAVLLAYSFYSGGVYVLTTVPLMLAALLLLAYLMDRCDKHAITIILMGGSIGIGLCAYRLFPTLAYSANVPRFDTMIQSGSLLRLVAGAVASLFLPQILPMFDRRDLLNLQRHELEYGVGLAPLFILVAAVFRGLASGRAMRLLSELPLRKWVACLVLCFILLVPILISYSGLHWLLIQIPVIKSMSVMLRFWSIYIPILCITASIVLDQIVSNQKHRFAWSIAAIVLTMIQTASTNVRFYQEQIYDPAAMNVVYRQIRDGRGLPPINRIERPNSPRDFLWNDGFVSGATTLPCYEPMFGYDNKDFPTGRLEIGPVLQSSRGLLNLKNPACYVFPGANSCRPGDEFTDAQLASAEAFTHYKPFPYSWPGWQYAATGVTMTSALLCSVFAVTGLFSWAKRRRVMGR